MTFLLFCEGKGMKKMQNNNEIVINYDLYNGNGFAQILRNPNDESVFYIRTRLDRNTNENQF